MTLGSCSWDQAHRMCWVLIPSALTLEMWVVSRRSHAHLERAGVPSFGDFAPLSL